MASSSTPNHDFAPAWLRLPTNAQRASGTSSGDSVIRRGGDHPDSTATFSGGPITNPAGPKQLKSLSQEQQRRDRGRAAFPFRHHSIDADDHHHNQRSLGIGGNSGNSSSSSNGDYRLHAGQRQHSGSQPSLGGSGGSGTRRPLSRQDFRDGSKGFGGGNNFEHHNGGGDHYRSDTHWGRQRSFDRSGRSGSGTGSDLTPASSRSSGGTAGAKWREDPVDHIDKFDKDFPSLKSGGGESVSASSAGIGDGSVTSVSSVWQLDKSRSGKIQLSGAGGLLGKRLHLVKKQPARGDVSAATPTTAVSKLSANAGNSTTTSPGGNTTTVTNNGSTSVYRTLGSTKGPMLRRPSKDSGKLNGLPSKSIPPPSPPAAIPVPSPPVPSTVSATAAAADVLNACCLVTHPKSLLLAANKSDFLRELRDDVEREEEIVGVDGSGDPDQPFATNAVEQCNGHDEDVGAGSGSDDGIDAREAAAEVVVNGIDEQVNDEELPAVNGINIRGSTGDYSPGNEILSRSLEAEQRLLREMGWKEEGSEDEDVYAPLTEDEMKEFESLSKQIPKRNGFQRNVQFTWSPKRVLTIPSALHLESGGSSTSTSSDSDSD